MRNSGKTSLAILLVCFCSLANAEEAGLLARKQQLQERVRLQTRDLISQVFDRQIRLLRENHLGSLPYAQDLAQTRQTLVELAERRMTHIISTLSQKGQLTLSSEREVLQQVRQEIRFISESLIHERAKLANSLQVFQVREKTHELIRKQVIARKATEQLSAAVQIEQESNLLEILQDQHDIELLYFQLLDSLARIKNSTQPNSSMAQQGFTEIQSANLAGEMERITVQLESLNFLAAIASQTVIINTLQKLADVLGQSAENKSSGIATLIKTVRDLATRQRKLHNKTENAVLDDTSVDLLLAEQLAIGTRLKNLAQGLEKQSKAFRYTHQAESAVQRSRQWLFLLTKAKSLLEQKLVLKFLSQAEKRLLEIEAARANDPQEKNLAENISRLEQAQNQLKKISRQQKEVSQSARQRPTEAQRLQNQVKDDLQKMSKAADYSEEAKARLSEAARAAEQSVKTLQETGDENADTRQQAADHVQESIEKAQDQLDASLSSVRQQQKNAQRESSQNPQAQASGRKKNQQNSSTVSGSGESKRSGDSRTAHSQVDTNAKIRQLQNESWFAKLPPKIRQSVLAKSRRPAPRGYRRRLQKYFESLD